MFSYILKRLILFIPTLFLVSCLAFYLSRKVPNDPVITALSIQGMEESNDGYEAAYQKVFREFNYNLPQFYFSIRPSYSSWVPHEMDSRFKKEFTQSWANLRYEKDYIQNVSEEIDKFQDVERRILYSNNSPNLLLSRLNNLNDLDPVLKESLHSKIGRWENNRESWHYPVLKWQGFDNQYHHWISNFINGDFGFSLVDARPVKKKIWSALRWTLMLMFISLTLSLLIAFPLGIYTGMREGSRSDRWVSNLLFAFYSIPKFWLATMAIIFFTTAEYGSWTNIFPSVGVWYPDGTQSFLAMIFSSVDKLILPLIIIIIPDVAYLTRLIRASIIDELSKDYIKAAYSKGLSTQQVVRNHLMPNSLIPTITLMAGVLPGAMASSLVIEVIFNIPGVGRLMYDSIAVADWAVVFPILLLISILAVVIFLLADILIARLNPKINLDA